MYTLASDEPTVALSRIGQLVLCCVPVLLAWFSNPVNAEAASDDATIRVVLNSDILGTSPGVRRDGNTDIVLNHIFESLVAYREDLTIGPLIAESFTVSEDRKSYTFLIRRGLKFHNGQAVSAKDVKWSWDRYLDPATDWKCRRWFVDNHDTDDSIRGAVIQSVEVEDEHTVIFHLKSANELFLDLLANFQCLPAVVHRSSIGEDGKWNTPIGTGPYKLKQWRRGEYIALEKFHGYLPRDEERDGLTGGRNALTEEIVFQVLPDAAATKAALLSGGIDVYPFMPLSIVEEMKKKEHIRLGHADTLGWSAVLIQTRDSVLRDVRMRQAIAYAINRDEVAGYTSFGLSKVNSSGVPAAHPAHSAVHDEWYEYSPEKSKGLLKQLGYRGQVIKIQTNRKYPGMFSNALVVQAMLQQQGINAQLEVLDWASQLSNYYSGAFQLMTFSFSALANPTTRYSKLIGSKTSRPNTQWENQEAEILLQEAWVSSGIQSSYEIYEKLHQLMIDDVPIIGLYNAHLTSAVSDRIEGFEPWPLELPRLWGVSKSPHQQSP